jgi:GWxTD domain-containing protein
MSRMHEKYTYLRRDLLLSLLLIIITATNISAQDVPAQAEIPQNVTPDMLLQMNSYLQQGEEFLTARDYESAQQAFGAANAILRSSQGLAGEAEALFGLSQQRVVRMTPFLSIARRKKHLAAIALYEEAVGLYPENREFMKRLAVLHSARDKKEHYEKAEAIYLELRKKEPESTELTIQLARTLEHLGDSDASFTLLEKSVKSGKDATRSLFELSRLCVAREDYEDAEKHYWRALDRLQSDADSSVTMLTETKLVFADRDLRGYELAANKGEFLRRFWRKKDPTPQTTKNERLLSHFERIHFAIKHFDPPVEQRDYDDRGIIYIKYGEPDWRYIDAGDADVYKNESWVYSWGNSQLRNGLVFDFVKREGQGFQEVPDLRSAMALGFGAEDDRSVFNLYKDREDIHYSMYGRVARARAPFGLSLPSLVERYRQSKATMHYNAPPDAYIMDDKIKFLNMQLEMSRFRGAAGKTRYEIYYSFPVKDLDFDKRDDERVAYIDREIVVRDLNLEMLAEDIRQTELVVHKDIKRKDHIFVGQVNLEWESGHKEPMLNLRVYNEDSRREALNYFNIEETDFSGDSLMISDLQYSYDIRPATGEPNTYTKHGLVVTPHPSLEVETRDGVFVYYEIYNLAPDDDSRYNFDVNYEIERDTPFAELGPLLSDQWGNKMNLVSQRTTDEYLSISRIETRDKPNLYEFTSLDFSGLRPGIYTFRITIKNLADGSTVSRHMPLVLIEQED